MARAAADRCRDYAFHCRMACLGDDKAGNRLVSARKAKGMARIDDVDAESAAAAWYVNPAVPNELKRMLDATPFPA